MANYNVRVNSYNKSNSDSFPTPPVATNALLDLVQFEGGVLEPASGEGYLSRELVRRGYRVEESDIVPYHGRPSVDFLTYTESVDNIITNPPYSLAEKFVTHSLSLVRYRAAFLMRLAFCESTKRKELFHKFPPEQIIVMSKRLPFLDQATGTWRGGGTFAHAWFIWNKSHKGDTTIKWA